MAKKQSSGKGASSGSAVAPVGAATPGGTQAPPAGLAASAGAPKIDAVDLTADDAEANKAAPEPDPAIKQLNDALRKEQDDALQKQQELTRNNLKNDLDQSQQLSALKQQSTPLFGTLRL